MNNPFQSTGTPKQKPKIYTNDSILEALRNVGAGVTRTVAKDVAGKSASDALSSLLGQLPKTSGELRENQAIDLGHRQERQPGAPVRKLQMERQGLIDADVSRVREELAAVRQELKALSQSIQNFHQEVEKAIDEVPVNPGVYHVNFLTRLRSILKVLKEQIDDSSVWLNLTSGRKQKKQYWGMYKKHGTKFGLSSERTLATQAG